MAGLYPLSRMQQFDGNGHPLSGARLFLFDGGTSRPRVGYKDSSLTSAHPNPIAADSAGRLPLIYLEDGFYRQRLTSKSGMLIFDDDGIPVLSSTKGGSGTSVDPDSVFRTRDVKIRFDNQPLDGYVRLNGRTIGSASSGATERANADTQSLYQELWSFVNIGVVGGKGANSTADFLANKPLTLPNVAGRALWAADDQGAGTQNVITQAALGSDPTHPGATGGAQSVPITQANLPAYTLTGGSGSVSGTTGIESNNHSHAFSGTTSTESASHSHALISNFSFRNTAGGADFQSLSNNGGSQNIGTSGGQSVNHTHAVTGTTGFPSDNHTHGFFATVTNVQVASGGSGAAVNKLPPLVTFMIYIRL